jgi:hypothetical protein
MPSWIRSTSLLYFFTATLLLFCDYFTTALLLCYFFTADLLLFCDDFTTDLLRYYCFTFMNVQLSDARAFASILLLLTIVYDSLLLFCYYFTTQWLDNLVEVKKDKLAAAAAAGDVEV